MVTTPRSQSIELKLGKNVCNSGICRGEPTCCGGPVGAGCPSGLGLVTGAATDRKPPALLPLEAGAGASEKGRQLSESNCF